MDYKKMYDELNMAVHELYGSIEIPENKPYTSADNVNLGKKLALLDTIDLMHKIEKKYKQ